MKFTHRWVSCALHIHQIMSILCGGDTSISDGNFKVPNRKSENRTSILFVLQKVAIEADNNRNFYQRINSLYKECC